MGIATNELLNVAAAQPVTDAARAKAESSLAACNRAHGTFSHTLAAHLADLDVSKAEPARRIAAAATHESVLLAELASVKAAHEHLVSSAYICL